MIGPLDQIEHVLHVYPRSGMKSPVRLKNDCEIVVPDTELEIEIMSTVCRHRVSSQSKFFQGDPGTNNLYPVHKRAAIIVRRFKCNRQPILLEEVL